MLTKTIKHSQMHHWNHRIIKKFTKMFKNENSLEGLIIPRKYMANLATNIHKCKCANLPIHKVAQLFP